MLPQYRSTVEQYYNTVMPLEVIVQRTRVVNDIVLEQVKRKQKGSHGSAVQREAWARVFCSTSNIVWDTIHCLYAQSHVVRVQDGAEHMFIAWACGID